MAFVYVLSVKYSVNCLTSSSKCAFLVSYANIVVHLLVLNRIL